MKMTYFNYERIAEGYANHRPHFHPLVMEMLKNLVFEGYNWYLINQK